MAVNERAAEGMKALIADIKAETGIEDEDIIRIPARSTKETTE